MDNNFYNEYNNKEFYNYSTKENSVEENNEKKVFKKKFKTEICKNFEDTGYCKWGKTCCFAHGKHELKIKNCFNNNYKSKVCKHFHKNGFCSYGNRCQYFHINSVDMYNNLLTSQWEKITLKSIEYNEDMLLTLKNLENLYFN